MFQTTTGRPKTEMTTEVFMNMLTHSGDTGGMAGLARLNQRRQMFAGLTQGKSSSDQIGTSFMRPDGLSLVGMGGMSGVNPNDQANPISRQASGN